MIQTSYDELPDHLLEPIANHLSTSIGDLLRLRLVSKAWKAAVERCEAGIAFKLQQPTDIRDVCNSFSSLQDLQVVSRGI